MQSELFLDLVQERAGVGRRRADALTKATLQVLAEQVSTPELRSLVAQLPKELEEATPTVPHRNRRLSLGDFCVRVGELAGVDESRQLPAYVRCVFTVLAEAVSEGELRQVMDQLPQEFGNLLPERPERTDPDAFFARVQEYAQLADRGDAERTAGVTLNLLADRISVGQAGDLTPALPEGLKTYLRTNKKTPQSFDKEAYLDRVATAVGVTDHAAVEQRVRAVLRTLREWVSDREIDDTLAELPPEIAELFR